MATRAIMSRVRLDTYDDLLAIEFQACVGELLELPDVMRLAEFSQHCKTTRLQHCVNVAYYSYILSKRLRLDYRSAARAGLLHDLYLYDWKTCKQPEGHHAKAHPVVALRTARGNVTLNDIEEDAILKHMWPVTPRPPRYKEAFVVSVMDKYCCMCEVAAQLIAKGRVKYALMRSLTVGEVLAK